MSAPWQGYVRDLVTRAYLKLGYIAAGDPLSATDGPVAVHELIALIDSFGVDRLLIWHIVSTTIDLVADQQTYTIGQGGDFDIDRPLWIDNASVIDPTNADDPLEIPITVADPDQWANVRLKLMTSTYPTAIYYDYAFDTDADNLDGGLGNILTWPVPQSANYQLRLYTPTPMPQIDSLNDAIRLPPGYLDFLTNTLAVRLAPVCGLPVSELLMQQQRAAEDRIRVANVRPMDIYADRALSFPNWGSPFNWRTGTP